ncbi:MAG: YceD family protein [Comamonas sp.]
MSKEFSLDHLDVAAFAKAGATLEGQSPLSAFERLADEAQDAVEGLQVSWYAEGEHVPEMAGPGHYWLHLEADAQVPMVCQRCLGVAHIDVQVDQSFRFVKDEATAEAMDDEVEEDLLALSKDFNLRELIEDELIMGLPLVPMHDECPVQVPMAASTEDFQLVSEEKTNPFAVLAGLRKNGAQD